MMLIGPTRARDTKVEVFEELTIDELQTALQEWLDGREDEELMGIHFDADGEVTYRAYVLYTE